MRLTKTDFLPDVTCPTCKNTFDVETTYEENELECYGAISCPLCKEKLVIHAVVTFNAVRGGKDDG